MARTRVVSARGSVRATLSTAVYQIDGQYFEKGSYLKLLVSGHRCPGTISARLRATQALFTAIFGLSGYFTRTSLKLRFRVLSLCSMQLAA